MIVLYAYDDDDVLWIRFLDLEDEPPLIIQPHRVLVRPFPFQFLKMVPADLTQVSFIDCRPNCLYPLPERPHHVRAKTTGKFNVGFQPIQSLVPELNVHPVAVAYIAITQNAISEEDIP